MNETIWYHGTRRGFQRGGLLLPRSAHAGASTTAPVTAGQNVPGTAANWVYLTANLDLAWVYAFHGVGRGRPKVLVVRPMGDVEPDPEHSYVMEAFRCDAARVTAVLLEPTITEHEARTGWVV